MKVKAGSVVKLVLIILCTLYLPGCDCCDTQKKQATELLNELLSRTEQYIGNEIDVLEKIAQSDAAKEGNWEEMKQMLISGAEGNIDAIGWYALPDGSYYTTDKDFVEENLSDRYYWNQLMQGIEVKGALVVSKSTGKPSAVFAFPVLQEETVTGVVAYSIFLEDMTLQLQEELEIPEDMIFFILNEDAVNVGDSSDLSLIFDKPLEQTDYPALQQAVQEIMGGTEGCVEYEWLGYKKRAVFRLSSLLGWRFVVAYII